MSTPSPATSPSEGHEIIARPSARSATAHRVGDPDRGSMILAIMFAFVMSGLVILATATAIQGQIKTQDTRDFSAAHQASDQAFANALIYANLGYLPETSAAPITRSGSNGVTNWTWTATQTADPTRWNLVVRATGKRIDREYRAVLNSNRVITARIIPSSNDIDYIAENAEYFGYGFFGTDGVTVSGAPDIDGYNGVDGLVTSNNNVALDTGYTDAILLANTRKRPDLNARCTGDSCLTARRETKPQRIRLPSVPADRCVSPSPAWTPNSGPLVAGRCYASLFFNRNFDQAIDGRVYVQGDVRVNPNVEVNVAANSTDPSARGMVIHMAGTNQPFTIQPGGQFAGGVFNPLGPCQITGTADPTYATKWLGAASCRTISVQNRARLRYDGAMRSLEADTVTGTSYRVFYLSDYQIID